MLVSTAEITGSPPVLIAPTRDRNQMNRLAAERMAKVLIAPTRDRNTVNETRYPSVRTSPHRPYEGSQRWAAVTWPDHVDVLIAPTRDRNAECSRTRSGLIFHVLIAPTRDRNTIVRTPGESRTTHGPHRPYEGSQHHEFVAGGVVGAQLVLIAPTRDRNLRIAQGTSRTIRVLIAPTRDRNEVDSSGTLDLGPVLIIAPTRDRNPTGP